MKLLHFTWSARFGGIERVVFDLATRQRESGHEVGVALGRAEGELLDRFAAFGIEIHDLQLKSGFDIAPGRVRRAQELLSAHDLVHMHAFNPAIAFAAGRAGVPVVYTEHGNFGFGRRAGLSDRAKIILLRWFLNHGVDYVTFNSRFTEGLARERYGINSTPNAVVHNGIPLDERLAWRPSGFRSDPFIVGTISRFAQVKRIDRLIDGFALFLPHTDSNVRLLLVGAGPLESRLRRQADEVGVADHIDFSGYQANPVPSQARMDVCVFPSAGESFGLAALETLALGKPTLVFRDGGGILEVVDGLDDRDVVASPDELAERLLYYYQHPDTLADQRRTQARKFDLKTMTARFEGIYASVLSNTTMNSVLSHRSSAGSAR